MPPYLSTKIRAISCQPQGLFLSLITRILITVKPFWKNRKFGNGAEQSDPDLHLSITNCKTSIEKRITVFRNSSHIQCHLTSAPEKQLFLPAARIMSRSVLPKLQRLEMYCFGNHQQVFK
jgi:hypothetical protein